MKYLDNIVREVFQQICFKLLSKRSKKCQIQFSFGHNRVVKKRLEAKSLIDKDL